MSLQRVPKVPTHDTMHYVWGCPLNLSCHLRELVSGPRGHPKHRAVCVLV